MDLASVIGVIIGLVCFGYVGHHASHGHWSMFFSEEGLFTVFGGSISVLFMALPMRSVKSIFGYLRRFLFQASRPTADVIREIVRLSEISRREGILALEVEVKKAKDGFLGYALQMVIDGRDADSIETTLRLEIMSMQERHKIGKKFFDLIKLYGPGWGLVGTLIGQIGMFGQLGGSVEAMGKMLALAVTATMYGTVLANAVAGPIGDKLAIRSAEEIQQRELILQGILSMQAGENPRMTVDRMAAFVPYAGREKMKTAA